MSDKRLTELATGAQPTGAEYLYGVQGRQADA